MAGSQSSLSCLPVEVLEMVASCIPSVADLRAFSLINKDCYWIASKHLYQNVSVPVTNNTNFDSAAFWLQFVKRCNIHCTTDRSLTDHPETRVEINQRTTTICNIFSSLPAHAVRSLTFDHEFMHAPATIDHLESVLTVSSTLEELSIGLCFTDKDYQVALGLIGIYAEQGCFENLKRLELTGSYRAYFANLWLLEQVPDRLDKVTYRMHESGEEFFGDLLDTREALDGFPEFWLTTVDYRPDVEEYAFDDPCAVHEPRHWTMLMRMLRDTFNLVERE